MLFNSHHISFGKIDPLGDGLREEIQAERLEPEAITLDDGIDANELVERWQAIESDIEQDSEWIHSNEE